MTGVEILNITEHVIMKPVWSWQMCFGLFIGLFGLCVIIGCIQGLREDDVSTRIQAGLIAGLIVAFLGSPLLTAAISRKEVGKEYHYQVTIDDSVSMNEFLDKYEILDQEGKIYTIKEKNTDK